MKLMPRNGAAAADCNNNENEKYFKPANDRGNILC